ncbi:sensor histidine kinase [Pseudooceanicola sp. LIPI14-2-Ac024]|uniref:sensor histidine kinase n=1 Tax=Pseudooceanicola sp. LIPI14-2-Ac024 TaxID=3344875 RepID=UPI0035CFD006
MPDTASALLTALPLASVLIGRNERILGMNGPARALLGSDSEGRHFLTAIRHPAVLDAVEGCLHDRQPRTSRMLTTEGGQDMTYELHCAYLSIPDAEGVLLSLEDITRVEQAGQMRRDFVANVSHELRTPLTALLGFIETLRGPAKNDAEARERFLSIMAAEAERMERLVADLLSLSRVESEERMRPTARVDLTALTDSVLKRLGPVAQARGVELGRNLPEDEVLVPGDEDQLRQVLTNLVENAIKYGGSGGRVDVALEQRADVPGLRGPGARLSVRDYGPGIELVHIPRLTERFYRVDSHRSREMGGTGLGLAIVKHIVNRHRGRMKVESEPGQGAEFTVELPARA